ncbi:hypothetical protein [Planococcus lenghuensis]|nr:hypothetical protein [Planococcus lenghuensis]
MLAGDMYDPTDRNWLLPRHPGRQFNETLEHEGGKRSKILEEL